MKLTCLVNNCVAPSSRYWGEHGLSFLIESEGPSILFGTGASGTVLLHNLGMAHVAPSSISALVLSHGHFDHTGELEAVLERHRRLPLYAHPGVLRERFSRRGERLTSVGMLVSSEHLSQSAELRLSRESQEIAPVSAPQGRSSPAPRPRGT